MSEIRLFPDTPYSAAVSAYTRFGPYFEASEYTGWIDESMSWKQTCFIGDWPLFKLLVKGPDAVRFFREVSINGFTGFEVGRGKHSVMCNSAGQVMNEGVLMRLAEDECLFICGRIDWALYQFQRGNYDAEAIDVTESRFTFQVQGPHALYLLEKLTGDDLRDIGFMRFRKSSIDGMEFDVLRMGMAGEVGYELHGSRSIGTSVYNAILEAGQEFGIRRLGGRTKMVNHVEACFPTPTVDFWPAYFGDAEPEFTAHMNALDPSMATRWSRNSGSFVPERIEDLYRTPVELGWGRSIRFDHAFPGNAALALEVENPKRQMVTLVWDADDVVDVYASLYREGDPYGFMDLPRGSLGTLAIDQVLDGDALVGTSTSRCYSYYFRKMISLCTIDVTHSEPGTSVTVLWGDSGGPQKRIRATVAPAPFKQDKRRIDVTALPEKLPL